MNGKVIDVTDVLYKRANSDRLLENMFLNHLQMHPRLSIPGTNYCGRKWNKFAKAI